MNRIDHYEKRNDDANMERKRRNGSMFMKEEGKGLSKGDLERGKESRKGLKNKPKEGGRNEKREERNK